MIDPAFGVGPFKHRNASISAKTGWHLPGGRFRHSQFVSSGGSGFRGSDASGDDEFGELPAMVEVLPVRPSVAVIRRGFVVFG